MKPRRVAHATATTDRPGLGLASLVAGLLIVPANALNTTRAELRGDELRLEGNNATPDAEITVDGVALGTADGGGAFDIRHSPFASPTCVISVSDGLETETVSVDRCTPSGPPANAPPTANAGADRQATDADDSGAETVPLDGSASSDPEGPIASFAWTEGGAEIATGPTPDVLLAVGSHTITLTVTDGDGATDADVVEVTVDPFVPAVNQPPTAVAGADRTVTDTDDDGTEPVTLSGTGSSDPEGEIASYAWSEAGTPLGDTVSISPVLTVGVHTIRLTVTDGDGATDFDEVVVTVNAAPPPGNQEPVADAGPDQTVVDADDDGGESVTLDGSGSTDADGTIVSYEWAEDDVVLGTSTTSGTLPSAGSGADTAGVAPVADAPTSPGGAGPAESGWLEQVEANLVRAEYEASVSGRVLQAPNRANGLRTLFEPTGVTFQDRESGTVLAGLALAGMGRGSDVDPVAAGVVSSQGRRVQIDRPGLTEWYENSEAGLEQGFTLRERASGEGELVVDLAVDGADARLEDQQVLLATDAGRTLSYDKLVTVDADGAAVPSRLEVVSAAQIRIVVDDADAAYPIVIDPVVSSTFDQMFESNQPDPPGTISNAFGGTVGSPGDINNDGFDDIVIGAPIWDGGDRAEGAVFVFLGSAAGVVGSDPATAHARIEGQQPGAQLSAANGAGDVNGDGIDDLIVGAHSYSDVLPGTQLAVDGAAFVFHGSAAGITGTGPGTADATITSHQLLSALGATVDGAGDVNNDGFADVVVSVPREGVLFPPGIPVNDRSGNYGAILLFHGSAAGITGTGFDDADTVILPYVDTGEPLPPVDAQITNATGAGDVNGDGFDDLVVGGTELTLYLGGPSGITAQNIFEADERVFADPVIGVTQSIGGGGGGLGVEAAGDVNGDGFADILASVPGRTLDTATVDVAEGAAYVLHGGASGLAITSLAQADTGIVGTIGGESIGITIAGAGDVDNDTFDDILVGALHYAGSLFGEGAGYLFRGGAGGVAATSVAQADTRIEASQDGAVVFTNRTAMDLDAAGDVNGDGFADIIAGKGFWTNGDENEGAAFLYLGERFPANPNLPPVAVAGPEQEVYDVDADGQITVTVDGSASSDPDGSIVSYEWYLANSTIGTGATLIGTGPELTVTLPFITAIGFDGHYLTVVVTDDQGLRRGDRTKVYPRLAPTQQVFNEGFANLADWTTTGNVVLGDQGAPFPDPPHVQMTGNASLRRSFAVPAGTTGLDLSFWERGTGFGPGDRLVVRAGFDGGPMTEYYEITTDTVGTGFQFYGGSLFPISLSWWPATASTVTLELASELGTGEVWIDAAVVSAIMAPTGGATNAPPVADAGADRTVTDADLSGSETVTLDGSASSDPDGAIASFEWREDGVTVGNAAELTADFAVGSHTLELVVTDDGGLGATDTVVVIVEAGQTPTTISPRLAVGTHTITLTVTDDQGATATDTVVVTVEPAAPTGGGRTVLLSSTSGGTAGGVSFADEDLLAFDTTSGTWSMFLDGSDVGLGGAGARDIDAFSVLDDGSVLLSIVSASTLPDVGAVDDSDILRFVPTSTGSNTAGTFEWFLDGSDVGLTTNGEDVDAVTMLAGGDLLVSTTGSPTVPGLSGLADEDLIRLTPSSLGATSAGTWSAYFDGSDVGLATSSSEDTRGTWVDVNGDIHLTTAGAFSVAGASGTSADVFACHGPTTGPATGCASFSLSFEAGPAGFGGESTDGLHVIDN